MFGKSPRRRPVAAHLLSRSIITWQNLIFCQRLKLSGGLARRPRVAVSFQILGRVIHRLLTRRYDLYGSTKTVLKLTAPRLVSGTVIASMSILTIRIRKSTN